jgi:uncharacterized protein YegL
VSSQRIPLFGDPQPVPRTALSKRDRPPNVAIVYVSDDGQYDRIDGGRALNLGESLWTRYRYRFDVDTADHEVEMVLQGNELPSREPAFHFVANVEVGFRVQDPVKVVQRKVADGFPVVRTRIMELIRQICYQYDIVRVLDAEAVVNARFAQPVPLAEGIEVYRCFTRLSLDQGAAQHAARLRSAMQGGELAVHERRAQIDTARHDADLQVIRSRAETDDLKRRVEAISALNIDEQRLLEMYIAQNPNNAAEALNLLNAKEQARHERAEIQHQTQLKLFEFLVNHNLVRGPHITALAGSLASQVSPGSQYQQTALPSAGASYAVPAAAPAIPSQPTAPSPAPSAGGRGSIALGPVTPPPPPRPAYNPPAPAPQAPPPQAAPPQAAAPVRRPAARPPLEVPSTQLRLPQPPAGPVAAGQPVAPPVTPPPPPAAPVATSVQPIYLAVDASADAGRWGGAIESGLTALLDDLAKQPAITGGLHVSVLGFADTVSTLVPLGPVVPAPPPLLAFEGRPGFAAIFDYLLRSVPGDVAGLKQAGHRVNRPIVFLLCTSKPAGTEWLAPRSGLADRNTLPAAPNIVACGVGDVDSWTLRAVASRPEFGFVATREIDPAAAISAFWQSVGISLISSGMALSRGDSSLSIQRPDGFQIANDEI